MRRAILLTTVEVLAAGVALAQGGSIGLFADVNATDCDVAVQPGMLSIHLVHVNASVPVSGAEFRATPPECFDATFLMVTGAVPETFSYGSLATGWTVPYFGCGNTPAWFGTMYFFAGSGTSTCCYYTVREHAIYHTLLAADCSNNLLPATGGTLILNPDLSCGCNVPARETTWGTIKALYAE